MLEPAVMPAQRAVRVGRYELHDAFATGGMATVHLGRLLGPVGFSRTVAIKRLHPHFASDPDFLAMFVDEARLAAQVRHPNVVPTLDVVSEDGELFVVMEYVQGATLAALLAALRPTGGRLPVPVALSIAAGALHGLHAAHEARTDAGEPLSIVHRDVSPQNLMVGIDGVSRVLDFGVAKAASRTQATLDGQVKGKLAYMAPEQLLSRPVDRRVDVYAASVVLWEVLTGMRLFTSDSSGGLVHAVLAHEIVPPSALVPELPESIDALVMRGLARDRDARFATARDMVLALERVGELATSLEVGQLVERLAGSELSRRVDAVERVTSACTDAGGVFSPRAEAPLMEVVGGPASVESTGVTGIEPATTLRAAPRDARVSRRRSALMIAAVTAAAVVATVVAVRGTGTATPDPVVAAGTPAEARRLDAAQTDGRQPPAVEPAPPAEPPAASAGTPSTSASVPQQPRAPSIAPRPRSPSAVKEPTAKKPDCNPAFEFDAEGNKRYKPGCLDR
jgi:serine/threonine-protein kinase